MVVRIMRRASELSKWIKFQRGLPVRIVSYIACGEIMKLQFRVSVILVLLPSYVLPFYLKLLIRKEIVADHSVWV